MISALTGMRVTSWSPCVRTICLDEGYLTCVGKGDREDRADRREAAECVRRYIQDGVTPRQARLPVAFVNARRRRIVAGRFWKILNGIKAGVATEPASCITLRHASARARRRSACHPDDAGHADLSTAGSHTHVLEARPGRCTISSTQENDRANSRGARSSNTLKGRVESGAAAVMAGAPFMEKTWREKIEGTTDQILAQIRKLIDEGNIRRVVVKHQGKTVAEFPLTVGVVGTVIAPVAAAAR
jgi:hypothetical protein